MYTEVKIMKNDELYYDILKAVDEELGFVRKENGYTNLNSLTASDKLLKNRASAEAEKARIKEAAAKVLAERNLSPETIKALASDVEFEKATNLKWTLAGTYYEEGCAYTRAMVESMLCKTVMEENLKLHPMSKDTAKQKEILEDMGL